MSLKKKVIFCTYSSIYSSKVLEQLLLDDAVEVVAIINSTRVLRPSFNPLQGALVQLKISGLRYSTYLFMTTGFFNLAQSLLFYKKNRLKNVRALAKLNTIPIMNTRDINLKEVSHFIESKQADFLLCAHFNQLLKAPILDMKNIQCLNIHPSLLPKYKGVDPVFFAMKDEAKAIGVSLHEMNVDFDCGKVLLQSSIKNKEKKSLLSNNCRLFEEGAELALKFMKSESETGVVVSHEKNKELSKDHDRNKLASYDSWPNSSDVSTFRKAGHKLITLKDLWSQL